MKLFRTTDMRTIVTLQDMFSFALPSVRIARRTEKYIHELTSYHALSYLFFFFCHLVSLVILLPCFW